MKSTRPDHEVIIVGAGVSGIGAAIALQERGFDDVVLLERGSQLGGTWRDNTYPGVAVDIPSSSYCFSFDTDYPWSRTYAPGAEILDYLSGVADKHGIPAKIRYETEVASAQWEGDHWVVSLTGGSRLTAHVLIAATGQFAKPVLPDIDGLDAFEGTAFHTARWQHGHDLAGKRVAIIGTGASAIQVVPSIAPRVTQLTVFQRTPIWVSPRPDFALGEPRLRRSRAVRKLLRARSEAELELLTFATAVYRRAPWLIHGVQAAIRAWMRRQVDDPATREALIPRYDLGCKRPASSNDYLRTYNRDNVRLVTSPIERIEGAGVRTGDGELHRIDTLVLATGFTTTEKGTNPAFPVHGPVGELSDIWEQQRIQAYKGVAMLGFPNFFFTHGPYSGGFNWFAALEANLGLIGACLDEARQAGASRIEVLPHAHAAWMSEMWAHAEGTIFTSATCDGSNSYYRDRFGDASLPLPRWPGWRRRRFRRDGTKGFAFL